MDTKQTPVTVGSSQGGSGGFEYASVVGDGEVPVADEDLPRLLHLKHGGGDLVQHLHRHVHREKNGVGHHRLVAPACFTPGEQHGFMSCNVLSFRECQH